MTKKHPDIHDEFEESRDIEFSGIDPAKGKDFGSKMLAINTPIGTKYIPLKSHPLNMKLSEDTAKTINSIQKVDKQIEKMDMEAIKKEAIEKLHYAFGRHIDAESAVNAALVNQDPRPTAEEAASKLKQLEEKHGIGSKEFTKELLSGFNAIDDALANPHDESEDL